MIYGCGSSGGSSSKPDASTPIDAGDAGSAAASCGQATPEPGFVDVAPTDPAIRIVGRATDDPNARAFAYPGVSIHLRFEGDAIDLKLRDYGSPPSENATNYYDIIIDGGEPTVLQTCPEQEVYALARGLSDGEHTLEVFKRVESGPGGQPNAGKAELLGFRVREGKAVSAVPPKDRRIEFIGDSITAGYGNELSTTTPDDFPYTTKNSNARLAYGALTARALDAEYMAVAASGRGVLRNYSDFAGKKVPEFYPLILPEESDSPVWDFAKWTPDVVVINLGTNDFSPGIDDMDQHRQDFREAYGEFLGSLRGYYPEAQLIAAVGPMLSDAYPTGYDAWTNIQADVQAVVEARHTAGDERVHYFKFTPQRSPYGEDWHPTVATHQAMADALVPFIQELQGW